MCQTSDIPCNCGCNQATGFGFTATAKRVIRSGREYDQYFDLSGINNKESLIETGGQKRTIDIMERFAKRYKSHTAKLAPTLKRKNLINTLSEIWHFVYEHIQYTLDERGKEQLRSPLRTWADREKGVDCDCYSIFISSILHNLQIPHAMRMTKYKKEWQHVYIVVPKNGKKSDLNTRSEYYVLDAVSDRFNHEVPFKEKYDRFMNMPIYGLTGTPDKGRACDTPITHIKRYIPLKEVENQGLVSTEKLLKQTGFAYEKLDTPDVLVETASGLKKVPTVISRVQATALVADAQSNLYPESPIQEATLPEPTQPVQAEVPCNKGKGGWLIAALLIGGTLWVLSDSSGESKSSKKKPVAKKKKAKGLSGTPDVPVIDLR